MLYCWNASMFLPTMSKKTICECRGFSVFWLLLPPAPDTIVLESAGILFKQELEPYSQGQVLVILMLLGGFFTSVF